MAKPQEPKPRGAMAYWLEPVKVIKDPKLVALKCKRREELVEQFYKHRLCPQAYSPEASNTIFDPAIQRYVSTFACMEDYYRTNSRSFLHYMGWIIGPCIGIYLMNKWWRDREEYKHRTGQIAHKDREFKFAT